MKAPRIKAGAIPADPANPFLDDIDAALLRKWIAKWDKIQGPREGDWCDMPDGVARRFVGSGNFNNDRVSILNSSALEPAGQRGFTMVDWR
jgi:hypothetical protein